MEEESLTMVSEALIRSFLTGGQVSKLMALVLSNSTNYNILFFGEENECLMFSDASRLCVTVHYIC